MGFRWGKAGPGVGRHGHFLPAQECGYKGEFEGFAFRSSSSQTRKLLVTLLPNSGNLPAPTRAGKYPFFPFFRPNGERRSAIRFGDSGLFHYVDQSDPPTEKGVPGLRHETQTRLLLIAHRVVVSTFNVEPMGGLLPKRRSDHQLPNSLGCGNRHHHPIDRHQHCRQD